MHVAFCRSCHDCPRCRGVHARRLHDLGTWIIPHTPDHAIQQQLTRRCACAALRRQQHTPSAWRGQASPRRRPRRTPASLTSLSPPPTSSALPATSPRGPAASASGAWSTQPSGWTATGSRCACSQRHRLSGVTAPSRLRVS